MIKKYNPIKVRSTLLQTLFTGGASYGVEILQFIKDHTEGAIRISVGATYAALWSLEVDGLAMSYEMNPPPDIGGRPRKYYELTEKGLETASEERVIVQQLFQLEVKC